LAKNQKPTIESYTRPTQDLHKKNQAEHKIDLKTTKYFTL